MFRIELPPLVSDPDFWCKATEIVAICGREILDSRVNPTLEVELATVSGFVERAAFNTRRGRM